MRVELPHAQNPPVYNERLAGKAWVGTRLATYNVHTVKTGALSNSETIVDGTSIAIAIVSTFVLTAIAVSCLSAILGLVLHTHCNKNMKKKQAKTIGHQTNCSRLVTMFDL